MKRKLNNKHLKPFVTLAIVVAAAVLAVVIAVTVYDACRDGNCVPTSVQSTLSSLFLTDAEKRVNALEELEVPDYVNQDFIDPSRARTTERLTDLKSIVIHYTGNPGTTAEQNHRYFDKSDTLVCSHFLVGLDGEVIQCIPMHEQSAASNHRNVDTISIEICHPDKTGKFNQATYDSAVKLAAWICSNTDLDENDLIRHHDITGKDCPKYFVDSPDEWESFKKDVKQQIE